MRLQQKITFKKLFLSPHPLAIIPKRKLKLILTLKLIKRLHLLYSQCKGFPSIAIRKEQISLTSWGASKTLCSLPCWKGSHVSQEHGSYEITGKAQLTLCRNRELNLLECESTTSCQSHQPPMLSILEVLSVLQSVQQSSKNYVLFRKAISL